MSDNGGSPSGLDFKVDKDNLYREESITDLKIATIRQLIPIKPDGSDDTDREPIFLGSTQLSSPQGPIPIQARLEAATFDQAMAVFPKTMEAETRVVVENLKRLHEQEQRKESSRIITPGM